jgi:hypothetical protein
MLGRLVSVGFGCVGKYLAGPEALLARMDCTNA